MESVSRSRPPHLRLLTAEEILAPQPDPVPTPASVRVYDALVEYLQTVPDSGRLVELVTRRHELMKQLR